MLFSNSKQFASRHFWGKFGVNQKIKDDNFSKTLGSIKVFTHILARDINNLLAAMLLNIDYAELFIDNGNPTVIGETLLEIKKILKETTKLNVQMSSLKVFSKSKTRKLSTSDLER